MVFVLLYLDTDSRSVSKVGWHLLAALAAPSASSCLSETHSWPGSPLEHWMDYQNSRNLVPEHKAENGAEKKRGKIINRRNDRGVQMNVKEGGRRKRQRDKGGKLKQTRLKGKKRAFLNLDNGSLFSLFSRLIENL